MVREKRSRVAASDQVTRMLSSLECCPLCFVILRSIGLRDGLRDRSICSRNQRFAEPLNRAVKIGDYPRRDGNGLADRIRTRRARTGPTLSTVRRLVNFLDVMI